MGHVDRFTADLHPGDGRFYALLAGPAKDLSVAAVVSPGPVRDLEVSLRYGRCPDRHMIRVDVFDPEGRACSHFRRFVWMNRGRGRVVLPLALNETSGSYRVVATDILTRVCAESAFSCVPDEDTR